LSAVSEHFPWECFSTSGKKKAVANIKSRVRMVYNYLTANLDNRLVLGTSNKTELLLGYFTKHGDGACDLEVIGGLYKTQVLQLAKYLGIPDSIVCKVPSAGLWKGQTDESEIGMKYSEMDAILCNLVDCELSIEETAKKTGLREAVVEKIADKIAETQHKRRMPEIIGI
jgi:NAD+ synthase